VCESTEVHRAVGGSLDHPVRLGTVHLDGGGIVIARLEEAVDTDDDVLLFTDRGAPVARSREELGSATRA
jgi:hypothetical protein